MKDSVGMTQCNICLQLCFMGDINGAFLLVRDTSYVRSDGCIFCRAIQKNRTLLDAFVLTLAQAENIQTKLPIMDARFIVLSINCKSRGFQRRKLRCTYLFFFLFLLLFFTLHYIQKIFLFHVLTLVISLILFTFT